MDNYDEMLQKALQGNTNFSISQVFSEAWQKVKGVKGSYWGAFGLYFVAVIVIAVVVGVIATLTAFYFLPPDVLRQAAEHNQHLSQMPLSYIIFQCGIQLVQLIIMICVYFPMIAGIMLIGLRWVINKEVSAYYVTKFYKKSYILRFFLMWLFIVLVLLIPTFIIGFIAGILSVAQFTFPLKAILVAICVMLVLLIIYLMVSFLFAMPLVIDRFLKAWEALNVSRKVVTQHWFRVFFLFFFLSILMVISAIPIGIPLIWTMPWAYNVIAITYRELFGIAGQDPVTLSEPK